MSTLATRRACHAVAKAVELLPRRCHRWRTNSLPKTDTFCGAHEKWPRSLQQGGALQHAWQPDSSSPVGCNGMPFPDGGCALTVLVVTPSWHTPFAADFSSEIGSTRWRVSRLLPDMTHTLSSVRIDGALPGRQRRSLGNSMGSLVARFSRRVSSPAPGQVLTSTCGLAPGDPLP
jgi:hypothetical protein